MQTVYLRADGDSTIGLGHVFRALALAEILGRNFRTVFLIQTPSEILADRIKEIVDEIIILPRTADLALEAHHLLNLLEENSAIVLDGYDFETNYQKILKSKKDLSLLCIDDIAGCHFVADAVINHSGEAQFLNYSGEPYTEFFFGPAYSLLRKSFRDALSETREIKTIKNLFICFGGSDAENHTLKIMRAAVQSKRFKRIAVVIGSAYLYRDLLMAELTTSATPCFLHENLSAEEMVTAIMGCELAVCPGSSIAYEACHVGIGMITGYYVNNQKGISNFLGRNDCADNVGDFNKLTTEKLISIFSEFKDPDAITHLIQQRKVFQNSEYNIKSIFYNLSFPRITIRRASSDDLMLYFDWANDEEVRANSINNHPISLSSHQRWFQNKLQNPNTFFYIFEQNEIPVAQVRIDFTDSEGLISYSIDKNYRGKGLGKIVIERSILELTKVKNSFNLKAYVKVDNLASLKIFYGLDFAEEPTEIIGGETYTVFSRFVKN